MKCKLLITVFLFFSVSSFAQKILTLYIFRPAHVKQISFYVKDKITLKLKSDKKRYNGTVVAIGDSNLVIANKRSSDTIAINQIRMIILNHSNFLTKSFSNVFPEAGVLVMGLDVVNNLLNHESQIVKPGVVKVGVSLIGAGIFIKLLEKRRHKIGKRKILKVIDLSPY